MQPSRSPLPELKLRKPMQRARIPAPFINPDTPSAAVPDPVDVDTLVPTHDERGRLIPEWKRQVMVRRLRARLADEVEVCEQEPGAWRFSPSHEAVLGPFGELLTEGDLQQLEWAVESLRLRRRGEAYQGELQRLAQELRALLPSPLLSITVHSPPPAPGQPLPLWCGRLAGVVGSLATLLANAEGARATPVPTPLPTPLPAAPRTPAGSLAQREIRQCGVSVRSLRGAFERHGGGSGGESEPGAVEAASDSGISCEEALSDGSGSPVPESSGLRKERIVLLFLSHWKRSAGGPNPWATACRALQAQRDAAGAPGAEEGLSRVGRLSRQRSAIQQLLGSWRDAAAHPLPPPPPPAGGPHAPLSPEQFVRRADGTPADYDSLTLELFMLGYFRILEQDLAPEERRGRHLLCFEVFDHLGRHGWEAARAFHRAVTDEIAAGRRSWKDSFEDIKARYFGTTKGSAWLPGMARGSPPQPGARRPAMGHTSEEICRCIDRSFAFWKEKEAEIFSFEE